MKLPKGLRQHYNWQILEDPNDDELNFFLAPTGLHHELLKRFQEAMELLEQVAEEGDGGSISVKTYRKIDNAYRKYREWK